MIWHDLLYFSTGEKRALMLLTVLLVAAVATLSLCSNPTPLTLAEQAGLRQQLPAFAPETPPVSKSTSGTPPARPATPPSARPSSVYPAPRGKTGYSSYPAYPKTTKYKEGTVVELNTADTTQLKMIPGIGTAFAGRIVKFRRLLGGFYTVEQLNEVYGITPERYAELHRWFTVNADLVRRLSVNTLPKDSLNKHPYISYKQTRVLMEQRRQKGTLAGWENLTLFEEFTEADIKRLTPYLSFD